jgi:hypothetical protein
MRHMKNQNKSPRRPGDLIIDRYVKDCSPEEREDARENLRAYARVLARIGERVYDERSSTSHRTSNAVADDAPVQLGLFG